MLDYLKIANNSVLYLCAIILVFMVFVQATLFLRINIRRGKELNISKEKMKKAFKSGSIASVIPTIAIIIALYSLAPALGIPISWGRLSVIGSMIYELTAAGIGAAAMGVEKVGGDGYTVQVFANSVWTMCFGPIWSVTICGLFLKKIKSGYKTTSSKDKRWSKVLTDTAFMSIFIYFVMNPILKGGLDLITVIISAASMALFTYLITKKKMKWLKEYAVAFSMIIAMVLAIVIS